ncbi:acetamidase [Xylariomycetidae sp. FL0641]|nr:acetamidase [Xylariomycetidae sp. FL0641]
MGSAQEPAWQERVRDKRARILASVPQHFIHPELSFSDTEAQDALAIPTFSATNPGNVMDVPARLLDAEELAITELKVEEIRDAIAAGTYTAVQVLNAFTHRAVIAHQLLHCCLEFMYPAALARAKELDAYFAEHGKLKGTFHGVPLSVKDQCRVKGTETTCGFVAHLGKFDEEDSLLVEILQDAGAVPFTKTTLSVGCMWGESTNQITGRASNPYNRIFTCGGSSGGEAALIGFRGSPLGIGSDLAGSIRTPCAYQGLFGLKPSSSRIPYYRVLNSMEGQETVPSVVGPISRSSAALRRFTETVVDAEPWMVDPRSPPIPWRYAMAVEVYHRPLRIAMLHHDNMVLPQPPIRRALRELEAKLRSAGHDVVPMFDLQQDYADTLLTQVLMSDADGDLTRTRALSGEPKLKLVDKREGDPKPLSILDSWALAMERMEYQARVMRDWQQTASTTKSGKPIDVYIGPVNHAVAHEHGKFAAARYKAYCSTVNLLDFTACTLPVGFVGVDDRKDESDTRDGYGVPIPAPTGELDRTVRHNYNSAPEKFVGMPVTLQVVGKRYEEEKVLGIMQVLEDLVNPDIVTKSFNVTFS